MFNNIISRLYENENENENKNNNILILFEYLKKVNTNLAKNCLYYKDFSFKLGKILKSKTLFNSSSSTIIKSQNIKDTYIMNTRIVNYTLNSIGKSNNSEKCITINKLSFIDASFNEFYYKFIISNCNLKSKYVGIEDIRLFNFNDEIFYIGSYYNINNDKVQIVSNKLIKNKPYENKIIITPNFETHFKWEKNWVFFNNDNQINIIYKWYPIYICSIDYENKSLNLIRIIENLPDIFKNFRGSTNGLIYDEKIWFIVHQQDNIVNDIKIYLHYLVVFDKNMKLLGYSKPFNFENKLIEYCLGMELSLKNNFIITYSTLDSSTKLVVFSPNYVNSLINYI